MARIDDVNAAKIEIAEVLSRNGARPIRAYVAADRYDVLVLTRNTQNVWGVVMLRPDEGWRGSYGAEYRWGPEMALESSAASHTAACRAFADYVSEWSPPLKGQDAHEWGIVEWD